MSGGKFALPALAVSVLAQMMLAQHAAGAAAGALRGEAEDAERRERLEETRLRFAFELQEARRQITQPNALFPAHQSRLLSDHNEILAAVEQARSENELWQAAGAIPHLMADVAAARMNQRFHAERDDLAAEKRLEMRLQEVIQGLEQIGAADTAALDPAGNEAAHRAVDAARQAVADSSPEAEALLESAAEAVALHARRGAEKQAERMAQTAHYERAATELRAIAAGLRRDPIVGKWQATAVEELDAIVRSTPVSSETPLLMEKVRERAAAIIKAASDAQFRADTRDYITNGIARSLGEMGFVVSEPLDEHPEHPATAKVFQASSASGKSVLVSVPIEGQVWYEVDGYTKTTSAGVGGDVTLACDEGERVLEEMHARLDEEFQVGMSEIWWEGKDPNRNLRRADSLPVTAEATRAAR